MIVIDRASGEEEMLVDYVADTVTLERSIDGINNLSFSVVKTEKNLLKLDGNGSYDMIKEFNKVKLNGEIYTILTVEENPYTKTVTCVHEFYDLYDDLRPAYMVETNTDLDTALNFLFFDTGWTFVLTAPNSPIKVEEFGRNNPIYLLDKLKEVLGFELDFTSNDRICYVRSRIGNDTDFQIRDGHNLDVISKSVDATGVKSRVRVYYNQSDSGVYLDSILYVSPHEAQTGRKWEKSMYVDVDFSFQAEEWASKQLKEKPEINIEVEFTKLVEAGFEHEVKLGDSLFLIDDRMDHREEVRVISMTTYPLSNRSPVIQLSNRTVKFTNIFVDRITGSDDREEIRIKGMPVATRSYVRNYVQSVINP